MKHHPPRLGLRFVASSHKTRVSSPGFRARWRNAKVIPGWTNTGMGRVRLPHIYRFYLSLTALPCRSRRSHTYSRALWRKRERESIEKDEKNNKDERKKRRDAGWDIPRWPRNGTVTSGCGTSVDTSFHFTSPFANIMMSRIRSSVRLRWFYSVYFSENFDISWKI